MSRAIPVNREDESWGEGEEQYVRVGHRAGLRERAVASGGTTVHRDVRFRIASGVSLHGRAA